MKSQHGQAALPKMLTGIQGFDEITGGGLPLGRTTLAMGGPGCGKTVFALQARLSPEVVKAGEFDLLCAAVDAG